MKHAISITETLSKIVVVEAVDCLIAEGIVHDLWRSGDIVLDSDSFQGVDFQHEPDFVIDDYEGTINEN